MYLISSTQLLIVAELSLPSVAGWCALYSKEKYMQNSIRFFLLYRIRFPPGLQFFSFMKAASMLPFFTWHTGPFMGKVRTQFCKLLIYIYIYISQVTRRSFDWSIMGCLLLDASLAPLSLFSVNM